MIRSDVLIAGGGPAGLAAAIALRQKGLDVLLADAVRPPIDKACGEGLMPDAQRDLAALGITVGREDGAAFDGISFFSGRHEVSARFERADGIGIRRPRLHTLLVERSRQVGVRFAWGSRIDPNFVQWHLDGEPCSYLYAVGADGQSSRVRRLAGLEAGTVLSRRFGARRHYQLEPWSNQVQVHWSDLGQAYVTPVGSQEVCVAAVVRSPETKLEAVLASLPALRARINGAVQISAMRGALTTTRSLRRVTTGRVALVGDASGSVDAVTGEGIALALRQALLLAEAISADDLAIYESAHPAILHIPRLMARLLLSMDNRPWWRDWVMGLLAAQPQVFAHLLGVHLGERRLYEWHGSNSSSPRPLSPLLGLTRHGASNTASR
jgi:menaquinone-9 beta-reductase